MRIKRVQLSGSFLTHLFTTGIKPKINVVSGLPFGTKFLYAVPDVSYGIWMVIEHESFDMLKDGDVIPILNTPIVEALN